MSSRVPLVLGTGSFGLPGPDSNGARIHTVEDARSIVDNYIKHGYNTIDTARLYGGGTSEQFLGRMGLPESITIDTKVYPGLQYNLTEAGIRESVNQSLAALGKHKIRTLYLHKPDPTVPIETTLQAINTLYIEGAFEQFGLSNFSSCQVADIVRITIQHGWVKPSVYQGGYNAIERTAEHELFPCLRQNGIKFFAYSPLAGGLLVGNMLSEEDMAAKEGGRWDPRSSRLAPELRSQYAPLLPVVRELKEALDGHGVSLPETSQRWLQHHSALGPTDGVIIGVASLKQMEMNLRASEGGPLPEDIVALMERAWLGAKAVATHSTP